MPKKYYNSDYKRVSQSLLKTFIKSRELYKQKYIDKTIVQKTSDAMILGSAVECYCSDGRGEFLKQYTKRVLKGDDPELYAMQKDPNCPLSIMSETNFNKAIAMGEKLLSLPDMQFLLKNALRHTILEGDHNGLPLIGELDFIYIDDDNDKAIIVDLKTSQSADKHKFNWSAVDYGYYLQAAFYRMLLRQNYPGKYKNFEYYLLVIDKEIVPNVAIYQVADYELDVQEEFILEQLDLLAEAIKSDNFSDPTPSFNKAQIIGRIDES